MLSYLPWKVFDELVAAHGADKWVRTLSTKWQFVALFARSGPGWRSRPAGIGGWYCVVGGARFGPWSDRRTAENVMKVEQRRKAA